MPLNQWFVVAAVWKVDRGARMPVTPMRRRRSRHGVQPSFPFVFADGLEAHALAAHGRGEFRPVLLLRVPGVAEE